MTMDRNGDARLGRAVREAVDAIVDAFFDSAQRRGDEIAAALDLSREPITATQHPIPPGGGIGDAPPPASADMAADRSERAGAATAPGQEQVVPGRRWTEARLAVLTEMYPRGVPLIDIVYALNVLPGPVVQASMVNIQAGNKGLRRPSTMKRGRRVPSPPDDRPKPDVVVQWETPAPAVPPAVSTSPPAPDGAEPIVWADAAEWVKQHRAEIGQVAPDVIDALQNERRMSRAIQTINRARRAMGLTPWQLMAARGPLEPLPVAGWSPPK